MKVLGPTSVQLDAVNTRAAVVSFADGLQQKIATTFELSRTWGGSLKPNKQSYTVDKILEGFDIRRGHRTGALQTAMYEVPCWRVSGGGGKPWRVTFTDTAIRARLTYAEYFIEAKVKGGSLMGFKPEWAREVATATGIRKERTGRVGTTPSRGTPPPRLPTPSLPRPLAIEALGFRISSTKRPLGSVVGIVYGR